MKLFSSLIFVLSLLSPNLYANDRLENYVTQDDLSYDYNAQDSYLDFKYDNLAALKAEISKYSRMDKSKE